MFEVSEFCGVHEYAVVCADFVPDMGLVGISGLLGACLLISIFGEPVLAYTIHTAEWLAEPSSYIGAVLSGGGR